MQKYNACLAGQLDGDENTYADKAVEAAETIGLTEEDVKAQVRAHLAVFKIPAYVIIQATQLQRGATDKIFKRGIREVTIEQLGL